MGVFKIHTTADGGSEKAVRVSACSSAANLQPLLPGLPVHAIALVSAQWKIAVPVLCLLQSVIRGLESLSLSHFTVRGNVQRSGRFVY